MELDYENVDDRDNLSTEEIRARVREALQENNSVDADDINVHVENGVVRLLGRVGTEGERRVAEHIVTDVLGIMSVRNELVVDELRRAESPEVIDDRLVDDADHAESRLDDRSPMSDESRHLADNVDGELYGTTDMKSVMEDGIPYTPPDSPTQEGFGESDNAPGAFGEDR